MSWFTGHRIKCLMSTLCLLQTATPKLLDYSSHEEEEGEVGLCSSSAQCKSAYCGFQAIASKFEPKEEVETEAAEAEERSWTTMYHPLMETVVKVFGRVTRVTEPTGTTFKLQAYCVRPVSGKAEYDCHLMQAIISDELCIHGRYIVRCSICTPMGLNVY